VCECGRSWEERQREKERTEEREKKKRKSKTVTIKLQKLRDGSDCSFEIWKFNLY
jgi:hypothetical protein